MQNAPKNHQHAVNMVASSILIHGKPMETKKRFVEQFAQLILIIGIDATRSYWILDTTYQQSVSLYCQCVDAVLYFVEIGDEHQITQDINALKAINHAMLLLLVVMPTKDDWLFMSITDYPALWIDNLADMNRENTPQMLDQMIDEKKRRNTEALIYFPTPVMTPMANTKACLEWKQAVSGS